MHKDPRTSQIQKHSVTIAGHRTSVSVERAFWEILNEAARTQNKPLNHLIEEIDNERTCNLSSAIRLFVLGWVRNAVPKKE